MELWQASDTFGLPLPGPPHAIYLDPQAAVANAVCSRPTSRTVVLNHGKPLRPSGDARGWRWRESLLAKRDGSLVDINSDAAVAHVDRG